MVIGVLFILLQIPLPALRFFSDEELAALRAKPATSMEGVCVSKWGTIVIERRGEAYHAVALNLDGLPRGTEVCL